MSHVKSERILFSGFSFNFFITGYLSFFISSKIISLSLGYSADDYATLLSDGQDLSKFLLSQGRFTFALIQSLIDFAGIKQPELAGIGFFLAACGSLAIYWTTLADWLQNNRALAFSIGALLGSHPFITEYFSFRQAIFPMAICFMLVAAGAYSYRIRRKEEKYSFFYAASFAALAAGINQLAMSLFCISIFAIGYKKLCSEKSSNPLLNAFKQTLFMGGLATLIYFIFFISSSYLFPIQSNDRLTTISASQIPQRLYEVILLLGSIISGSHPLIGKLSAICLFAALVILSLTYYLRRNLFISLVGALIVMVLGIAIALLPVMISKVWWPVPRTLIALPLIFAIAATWLAMDSKNWQKHTASTLIIIASIIFSAKSASMLINQQRLNRWDISLAREIVQKISETQIVTADTPIVLHQAKWGYEVANTMAIGDTNVSALSIAWSVDQLFEEATGRKLKMRLETQKTDLCIGRPAFPDGRSIVKIDNTINVCL